MLRLAKLTLDVIERFGKNRGAREQTNKCWSWKYLRDNPNRTLERSEEARNEEETEWLFFFFFFQLFLMRIILDQGLDIPRDAFHECDLHSFWCSLPRASIEGTFKYIRSDEIDAVNSGTCPRRNVFNDSWHRKALPAYKGNEGYDRIRKKKRKKKKIINILGKKIAFFNYCNKYFIHKRWRVAISIWLHQSVSTYSERTRIKNTFLRYNCDFISIYAKYTSYFCLKK